MDFEWHELSNNKYRYKTSNFTQNTMNKRFSRLNHEYMLITVASYGGPIAITSDKRQILTLREEDPTIQNICIYSNEGQLTEKIMLDGDPLRNIIVHLQFLQDEYLLAIFQKGQEWIIDPYTTNVRKFNILGMLETEQIQQAKVFQNGFAILTSFNRFLFVANAFQPQAIEFRSCEEEIKMMTDRKLFWTVFAPKLIISERIQLHLCHPTCGIIQVIEDESKRVFYNRGRSEHIVQGKLPNLEGLTYISELSPNRKMVAYFSAKPQFEKNPLDQFPSMKKKREKQKNNQPPRQIIGYEFRLIFAPSITSDAVSPDMFFTYQLPFVKPNHHVDDNLSPLSIKWCGNKSVVIQFWTQELYMYSIDGDYAKIEKDRAKKWCFLKQEIDGLRILNSLENKIMRQIPAAYVSIFQSFSEQPGALLYATYEAFQEKAPLQDDQIRKQKKKLAIGVEQCIRASRFQLNFDIITKLMKAATYGKAFLPPNIIPNNLIYDTSKMLRILHCFRNQERYITLDQLQSLSDDMLLKILLRYRQHYLAFEIYQYLKKDQNFRIKLFTDWACCKVENVDKADEEICEEIRKKLESEKGVSFTQIAHKAIEVDRSELALQLLRYQPSLSKKVPLLLWIGTRQSSDQTCWRFFEKALEESLRSRDLNLLFLTIRKIMISQRMGKDIIFQKFSSHRQGRSALINYFRLFDTKSLIEYFQHYLHDTESVIVEYIKKSFEEKKYENAQALFQVAVEEVKHWDVSKEDWRKQVIPKIYGNLTQFIAQKPNIKYKNDKVKPAEISKQLEVFLKSKDSSAVDDIKEYYKIPDRRVIMGQIKVFMDERKWEDLETFVERNQKKYNIPVELITDMLLKRREDTWAMRMMARMPSKQKQQQYQLLQRIGRFKEAIDLAADRKDFEALEDMSAVLIDANLLAYANEKIGLLRRR